MNKLKIFKTFQAIGEIALALFFANFAMMNQGNSLLFFTHLYAFIIFFMRGLFYLMDTYVYSMIIDKPEEVENEVFEEPIQEEGRD